MKKVLSLCIALTSSYAVGESLQNIVATNTPAIVFIEVENAKKERIDSGTGFIVSQDGYVVTAAHIKADPTQRAWAVIGQRDGTRIPLVLRETDEVTDTALWKLAQSPVCRHAVILSSKPVKVLDRMISLGFPGTDGLTPSVFSIANLNGAAGFYKADGLLRPGNSGGPVFNEAGQVVALVEGGVLANTANNDLIPIASAISLIRKHGVNAGVDLPVPFATECYATCRAPAHGVERWTTQQPWGPVNSGWLGGGHNPSAECANIIAGVVSNSPSVVELLPGQGDSYTSGMWEESKKDIFGRVEYRYFCRGTLKTGPIYAERQSAACGLFN